MKKNKHQNKRRQSHAANVERVTPKLTHSSCVGPFKLQLGKGKKKKKAVADRNCPLDQQSSTVVLAYSPIWPLYFLEYSIFIPWLKISFNENSKVGQITEARERGFFNLYEQIKKRIKSNW